MKKLNILIIASLLVFTSCQKVVDSDKLLDTEEKVNIVGYLSPTDTVLLVHVSKALPAIGTPLSYSDPEEDKDLFLIKNATVQISNSEGNMVNLLYSTEKEAYVTDALNLSIVEGQEYFLEVQVDNNTYTSSCKIPKKITTINHSIAYETDEYDNIYADITFDFNDIQGERNFYMLGGYYVIEFENELYPQFLYFDNNGFVTDAIDDGITLGEKTKVYYNPPEPGSSLELTLQVAHLEEIMYQNLYASYLNNNNDGNPFVEYSISPDNIEGINGIGVFAGYNLTEKVVEIGF